jgi:uncharacterized protein YbjT (DUF2867 family)
VIDRGKQQERGDQPVDPYAAEIGRAVVAGAGRAGQERRRDRERGGRRDREQDDRLQRVHRADDDVQTAQPGGRLGVDLGWRGIGHAPQVRARARAGRPAQSGCGSPRRSALDARRSTLERRDLSVRLDNAPVPPGPRGRSVARRALVTGATGFVGGRLAAALADRGWAVRCLVRDRSRAQGLADRGFELHEADVLDADALRGAGEGVEIAYYLIHAMGRGARGEFEERERQSARNFAEMAEREGVARVIYLGGLGDRPGSAHLRSRHRTAEILSELGPPLTYFRAGMIVGEESESYRTLRYLVQRLPAMIGPAWLKTPTQAIAIDDVIAYLVAAPDVPASAGREVQIAGPDVLSYGEMLDLMADALGVRRRPRVPVPLITPWLSSHWIGLVTPVDAGVARPLVEGLSTPTTVTDGSGAELFDVHPMPFMDALRKALDEDHAAPAPAG